MIAPRAHKARTADGHQQRARTHHDRKGHQWTHAEQAHEDETRCIQAHTQHHQRAEQTVRAHRKHECGPVKSQRLTPGRQPGEILRQHESCRDQQCHAHTELDEAPRGARHHARTQPGADHCRDDHGDERREVHRHDRHKDERFHHGGQGVADVQGPRDVLVRHAPLHLEDGGRGREASDTQSVEEVGAETDQDIRRARRRAPARRPLEGEPAPQVAEARGQERRQERVAAVEVQRLQSRCVS